MLEDRTVVLMTDAELEAAQNPPAEKPQTKAVKSAPETKDVKNPDVSKSE